MAKAFLYYSPSLDPFHNLALEEWILRQQVFADFGVLLWRSHPAVVMGKFQNPWWEANLKFLKEQGITLCRRISGGGCVYLDEGNLNISYFTNAPKSDEKFNFSLIQAALNKFGIEVTINERKDILYKGLKVAGSAFKNIKSASLHHHTLLLNSNLDQLSEALCATLDNIETKSIPSTRVPVIKLECISSEQVYEGLREALDEKFDQIICEDLDLQAVAERAEQLKSWDWIFGETPRFTAELPNGFSVSVEKGIIQDARCEGEKVCGAIGHPMPADIESLIICSFET